MGRLDGIKVLPIEKIVRSTPKESSVPRETKNTGEIPKWIKGLSCVNLKSVGTNFKFFIENLVSLKILRYLLQVTRQAKNFIRECFEKAFS